MTGFLVYIQLALGMVLYGSATPVSKIVTAEMPVFIGSIMRVGTGALVLLPFVFFEKPDLKAISLKEWGKIFLVALFGMVGFSVFMLYGMRMISGVAGSVIMSTTPAVTAIGSFLLFHDRLGSLKAGAIALSVLGVLILHLGGGEAGQSAAGLTLLAGSALVFAAVCCEAAYTLIGKNVMRSISPLFLSFLAAALSLPLFLPAAIWQWPEFSPSGLGWQTWLAAFWWGAGTLGMGSVLWYTGVQKVKGSVAAGFMGVMPVSALVLSYVLLGEPFLWHHLAGFATVFAGILLIIRAHLREAE